MDLSRAKTSCGDTGQCKSRFWYLNRRAWFAIFISGGSDLTHFFVFWRSWLELQSKGKPTLCFCLKPLCNLYPMTFDLWQTRSQSFETSSVAPLLFVPSSDDVWKEKDGLAAQLPERASREQPALYDPTGGEGGLSGRLCFSQHIMCPAPHSPSLLSLVSHLSGLWPSKRVH